MTKKNEKRTGPPTIQNRQASFEYSFIDKYVAGIVLTGSEIKSVRAGKVELAEAYCAFAGKDRMELQLLGCTISPYSHGGYANHEARRPRTLLLKAKEIAKLKAAVSQEGLTIVPVRLFFNDRGFAKLEIALAKGKKLHDKRDTIKERDSQRALRRGDD